MILHNGILSPDCVDALLPTAWSYCSSFQTLPQTPNYLKERPDVIPIDCGRQLFVDDFLIEESSLHREFYSPEIKGMVLTPETVLEMDHGNCPVAAPFKDGVFYDPTDKKFKLWYQAGWFGAVAYAESRDGFHWIRPHIAVDGSNRILPAFEDRFRDGCSIWLDQNADTERFKMFLFTRDRQKREYAELRTSANGLDWSAPSRIMSCGDTTSLFYNPFRDRWVLSVRSLYQKGKYLYRYRSYREAASFSELADCRREYFWQSADANDERDDIWDCDTQLYSLDCVAYESIMLGIFQIFKGPHNAVAEQLGEPKKCDLYIGFSRDGIQFSRLNRKPFIAGSGVHGAWDEGYIHPASGICIVNGDELLFYFGAWSGNSPRMGRHMYAGGSTGVATLRRDGFAALTTNSTGRMSTPPVCFHGEGLWVNAQCKSLRAEIQDKNGHALPGLSFQDCICRSVNSTKQQVLWNSAVSLHAISGKPVRIAFELEQGKLFSFWISNDKSGSSGGYLAAGSVQHSSIRDETYE